MMKSDGERAIVSVIPEIYDAAERDIIAVVDASIISYFTLPRLFSTFIAFQPSLFVSKYSRFI